MRSRVLILINITVALLTLLWAARGEFVQGAPVGVSVGSFRYYDFTPSVIYANGVDSTKLEVATAGSDIAGVYVQWWGNWLQMYDDGTHGDEMSGDGIYTRDNLRIYLPPDFMPFEGDHTSYGFQVKIVKVGGEEEIHWEPSLGLVSSVRRFLNIDLGNGLSATKYAFFIVDSGGEIFPGMPLTEMYCGKTFPAAYQRLYSVFPDVFDFIILMPNGSIFDPVDYQENVPYYVGAKNEVQHIGIPIFDDTADFYSAGRLRGFIYHSWGYGAILDHEIGHAWGVRLGHSLGLATPTDMPGARYGHWVAHADVNGQMSEFVFTDDTVGHLVDNQDGTWRVEPEPAGTFPYAPLELYLMGLIPPEEVPPVHLLVNPDYSDPQRVTAEQVITITIEQLMVAEGGKRVPSYPNAQTSFNAAFVVVSDQPFTDAEVAYYSLVAQYFASRMAGEWSLTPFYTATGGRASLNVCLPVPGWHEIFLPICKKGRSP